jgi:hypothetical protein
MTFEPVHQMRSLGNFLLRFRTCSFSLLFPCWSISRTPFPESLLAPCLGCPPDIIAYVSLSGQTVTTQFGLGRDISKLLSYTPNDGECDCLQTSLLRLGTLHEGSLWLVFPGRHFGMLCGRYNGTCQVSAIALPYLANQLAVSLHPRKTSSMHSELIILLSLAWTISTQHLNFSKRTQKHYR